MDLMKEVEEVENLYQDMEATYADEAAGTLGCKHYVRSCKLKCPECKRYFTCHKCHDEEHSKCHSMDRFRVKELLCMKCGTEQGVSERCVAMECGEDFAPHSCELCRVFTAKPLYHCHDCEICRIGNAEDFIHCKKCDVCILKDNYDTHVCIEKSHDANCPICHDTMNAKQCTETVVVAVCGHPLHEGCLNEYIAHGNFKCPVCSHVLGDMSQQFDQFRGLMDAQPMPSGYENAKAVVKCIDCSHTTTCKYHFLGHQCGNCKSFNTSIVSTEGVPTDFNDDGECVEMMESSEEY